MKRILVLAILLVLIISYMGAVWVFVPTEANDPSFSEHAIIVYVMKDATLVNTFKMIYKPALIAIALGAIVALATAFIKKLPSWVRIGLEVIIPAAAVFAYDVLKLKRIFGAPTLDYVADTIVLRADGMEDLYLKYLTITTFDILFAIAAALAVTILCELLRFALSKRVRFTPGNF